MQTDAARHRKYSPALLALLLVGCSSGNSDPADHVPFVPRTAVEIDVVRAEPWPDTWQAGGFVRKREPITLSNRFAGIAGRVAVKVGDKVKAGTVLVEFDSEGIESNLKQAESAPDVTPKMLQQAAEAVEMARLKANAAADEPGRARAKAALAKALERQSSLRAKKAGVEASRAAAGAMRDSAIVRAPVAGRISAVLIAPGKLVAEDTALVGMEPDEVYFETTVDSLKIEQVTPGTRVQVSLDRQKCSGQATVTEVVDSAAAGMKNVRATLPCKNPQLNYRGKLRFDGPLETVVSVAAAAVIRSKETTSIFLLEDGVARLRKITVGRSHGDRLEAIAGLAPGAKVVLTPPETLRDNGPVVVVGTGK